MSHKSFLKVQSVNKKDLKCPLSLQVLCLVFYLQGKYPSLLLGVLAGGFSANPAYRLTVRIRTTPFL